MNYYDERDNVNSNMMPFDRQTFSQPAVNMNQNNNSNINNPNGIQPSNNSPVALLTPQEAFIRGNLFGNLYQQYKNYKPAVLTANNEQQRMYLNYAQLAFAAHELNLYLDNYPDDRTIVRLFNDYRTMANQALRAYEEKFGPITITSEQLNQFPWMWEQLNFPWDEGGI